MLAWAALIRWGAWAGRLPMMTPLIAPLQNLVTFFSYWLDKYAAQQKPVTHPGKDAASVRPAGRLARRLVCPAAPAAQIKQAVFPRGLPGYSGTTLPRANGLAAPVVNSACASKYIADCDRPSGPRGRFLAGTLITKASSIALGSEVTFPWHDFARIDGAWCWAAR